MKCAGIARILREQAGRDLGENAARGGVRRTLLHAEEQLVCRRGQVAESLKRVAAHDASFGKVGSARQRPAQQPVRLGVAAAQEEKLAEVVRRRGVFFVDAQRSLVAGSRAIFVAACFQRDAEVDMRARVPRRDGERLPIALAGAREITGVLEPVSLGDELLGGRDVGVAVTGPVAFPQPAQHDGHSKRRRV